MRAGQGFWRIRRNPERKLKLVLASAGLATLLSIAWAQNPAIAQKPPKKPAEATSLAGSTAPKAGDTTTPKPQRERPIQMDVNMVLVNVTVTDSMNRLVTGLEKEHFQIYEEKDEQKITHFSNEDVPLSMGVV